MSIQELKFFTFNDTQSDLIQDIVWFRDSNLYNRLCLDLSREYFSNETKLRSSIEEFTSTYVYILKVNSVNISLLIEDFETKDRSKHIKDIFDFIEHVIIDFMNLNRILGDDSDIITVKDLPEVIKSIIFYCSFVENVMTYDYLSGLGLVDINYVKEEDYSKKLGFSFGNIESSSPFISIIELDFILDSEGLNHDNIVYRLEFDIDNVYEFDVDLRNKDLFIIIKYLQALNVERIFEKEKHTNYKIQFERNADIDGELKLITLSLSNEKSGSYAFTIDFIGHKKEIKSMTISFLHFEKFFNSLVDILASLRDTTNEQKGYNNEELDSILGPDLYSIASIPKYFTQRVRTLLNRYKDKVEIKPIEYGNTVDYEDFNSSLLNNIRRDFKDIEYGDIQLNDVLLDDKSNKNKNHITSELLFDMSSEEDDEDTQNERKMFFMMSNNRSNNNLNISFGSRSPSEIEDEKSNDSQSEEIIDMRPYNIQGRLFAESDDEDELEDPTL